MARRASPRIDKADSRGLVTSQKLFLGAALVGLVSILPWVAAQSLSAPGTADANRSRASEASLENSFAQSGTLFAAFARPFAEHAEVERRQSEKEDSASSRRIDNGLNAQRINFVIYVFGDTYEPSPARSVVTTTGSYTIISLDAKSGRYNTITISRDFDSPEVALRKTGDPSTINPSTRIGEAYTVGGFYFSKSVIEDATGLSADFQISIPDRLVAKIVDTLGGIDIEIPDDISLYEFYVDGREFAARDFPKGRWHLDGLTALGYAKAMPKGEYTMDTERVLRSQAVMEAAVAQLHQELNSVSAITLAPKLFNLATDNSLTGVQSDFDLKQLLEAGLGHAEQEFIPALFSHGWSLGLPSAGEGLYISAEYQGGGGGVRIPPGDMLIPIDGDPRGDAVKDYWKSVREFIRGKLLQ